MRQHMVCRERFVDFFSAHPQGSTPRTSAWEAKLGPLIPTKMTILYLDESLSGGPKSSVKRATETSNLFFSIVAKRAK